MGKIREKDYHVYKYQQVRTRAKCGNFRPDFTCPCHLHLLYSSLRGRGWQDITIWFRAIGDNMTTEQIVADLFIRVLIAVLAVGFLALLKGWLG